MFWILLLLHYADATCYTPDTTCTDSLNTLAITSEEECMDACYVEDDCTDGQECTAFKGTFSYSWDGTSTIYTNLNHHPIRIGNKLVFYDPVMESDGVTVDGYRTVATDLYGRPQEIKWIGDTSSIAQLISNYPGRTSYPYTCTHDADGNVDEGGDGNYCLSNVRHKTLTKHVAAPAGKCSPGTSENMGAATVQECSDMCKLHKYSSYAVVHKGECEHNSGMEASASASTTAECATACQYALGFIWDGSSCYCEANPAHPHHDCNRDNTAFPDHYTRYDFNPIARGFHIDNGDCYCDYTWCEGDSSTRTGSTDRYTFTSVDVPSSITHFHTDSTCHCDDACGNEIHDTNNCCTAPDTITLTLIDHWSDGWHGGILYINEDPYTLGGGYYTTFSITDNIESIRVDFTQYVNEITWTLTCGSKEYEWKGTDTGITGTNPYAANITDPDAFITCGDPSCKRGTCTTSSGTYQCNCPAAWTGDRCETDVDECLTNPCGDNAACNNTHSSYTCTCNAGYEGDPCTDINECTAGTDNCHTQATCTNTPGSYTCACNAGFSGDGVTCEDINECNVDMTLVMRDTYGDTWGGSITINGVEHPGPTAYTYPNPSELTKNIAGPITSMSLSIQMWAIEVEVHIKCGENTIFSWIGAQHASSSAGFSGDLDASYPITCTACGMHSECTNTIGSYSCACIAGYAGNPCTNINECNSPSPCIPGLCTDTDGSYTCDCTGTGYTGNNCDQDVDECIEGTHNCHTDATCTNTLGGYECACNDNFSGDGITCSHICPTDACSDNAACDTTQTSHIHVADYCDGQYTFSTSTAENCFNSCSKTYVQVGLGYCGCFDTCTETEGDDRYQVHKLVDYKCVCNTGYFADAQGNCKRKCDPNPCANGICKDYIDDNTLEEDAYECDCYQGYENDPINCVDADYCPSTCNQRADCSEGNSSAICACRDNFVGNPYAPAGCLCPEGFGIDDGACNECTEYTMNNELSVSGSCTEEICTTGYGIDPSATWSTTGGNCIACEYPNYSDGSVDYNYIPFVVKCKPTACNSGFAVDWNSTKNNCVDMNECTTDKQAITVTAANGQYNPFELDINVEYNIYHPAAHPIRLSTDPNVYTPPDRMVIHDTHITYNVTGETIYAHCANHANMGFGAIPLNTYQRCARGTCTDAVDDFHCDCPDGYEGKQCETDIDECLANPCARGTCADSNDDPNIPLLAFQCICPQGWTGNICDQDIDECLDSPCSQICTNTPGSYECSCYPGYGGEPCVDIDYCTGQCQHGATCNELNNTFQCQCQAPWTGDRCQFCPPGYGWNGTCAACVYPYTNNLNTHDAPCVQQQCGTDLGVVQDANVFDTSLHHTDTLNCEECAEGYHSPDTEGICVDIDECLANPCHTHATCENTLGSHTCTCNQGYQGDGTTCQDINECNTNPCHTDATCNNLPGTFECACNQGYQGDGLTCEDINECATNPCHTHATCNNLPGTFQCACKQGYQGDGFSCVNVNECTNSPCDEHATCTDTPGSYTCACNAGYSGDPCQDINECLNSPCHQDATCNNLPGTYTCACKNGYEGDGFTCTNIDECLDNPCGDHATCADTPGSYTCTCHQGYTKVDTGTPCQDIDECLGSPCGEHATCNNLPGDYECTCNPGFEGTPCEDINECLGSPCGQHATCNNLIGTFECTCNTGYQGDPCEDIDECDSNPCNEHATCNNLPGDYECTCNAGFQGDPCEDIDECLASPCDEHATCHNTLGGYECACNQGYEGDPCSDIDECLGSPCGQGTCTNTQGSFTCACDPGYKGTPCEDIDECLAAPCGQGTCTNTQGSYTCTCNTGYQGTPCVDIDECLDSPCPHICTNTPGAYACACYPGWVGESCDVDFNDCGECNHGTCQDGNQSYTCTCNTPWQGDACDECPPGYGWDGSCAPCTYPQYNLLTTHNAPCVNQSCPEGLGVVTDGFNHSSNNNCEICPEGYGSPEGQGTCVCNVFDDCGVCAGNNACHDACGIPNGDNSTCKGCDGIPNSGNTLDACDVCGGDGSSCAGCDGIPNSGTTLDICSVCGGDGTSCIDSCGVPFGNNSTCAGCDGIPHSGTAVDNCGVCGGDDSTCKGCDGILNSGTTVDACGICGGDNSTCAGCDGIPNSGTTIDECGICGGDNSCKGCDGIPNSGTTIDDCGICGGTNACHDACGVPNGDDACKGCDGIPNSGTTVDDCNVCGGNNACHDVCGVPNGDGSSCKGCDGIPNSGNTVDRCGICGGDGSTCGFTPPKRKCNAVVDHFCQRHGLTDIPNARGNTVEECCTTNTNTCDPNICARVGFEYNPDTCQHPCTIQQCCHKPQPQHCQGCQGTCVLNTCVCPPGKIGKTCAHSLNDNPTTLEEVKAYTKDLAGAENDVRESLHAHKKLVGDNYVAQAPDNAHEDDTCALGATDKGCGTVDVARDKREGKPTTVYAGGIGSWTVLIDGDNILSKQIKTIEGFDMMCWQNGWSTPISLQELNTFQCNGHTIRIASQTSICDTNTCVHGECTADGDTYACVCDPPYIGTHCDQINNNQGQSQTCEDAFLNGDIVAFQNLQCCTC